jgi:hypothetical protein
MVMTYLTGKKLPWKIITIKDVKTAKKKSPADALISLSLRTGILYPSTLSPNCIILFMVKEFLTRLANSMQHRNPPSINSRFSSTNNEGQSMGFAYI